MDIKSCYEIIGVKFGASEEEVKRQYRVLVQVWHPDRFVNNPSLQKTAEDKLKEINAAYDIVKKHHVSNNDNVNHPSHTSTEKEQAAPREGHSEKHGYCLPSIDLLDPVPSPITKVLKEYLLAQSELLQRKLQDFDIQGRITQVYPGPVFTTYQFELAPAVKVSKIEKISDDLAMAMKKASVRIVLGLFGKDAVGIEVQNDTRETVYFRQLLETPEYQLNKSKLKILLGKDIYGASVIGSIDKMNHMLLAGATGSGKSVSINTTILAILYNAKPTEVKLALIDPKMLELSVYADIPHLLSPVVTQPEKASKLLAAVVVEMERRYRSFTEKSIKNIDSYNKAVPEAERFPYIVVIIDELADLINKVHRDITDSINRLILMAKDAGIYLIVATQRPDLIKANFPSRISFRVSSKADARNLNAVGADKLLGMGDMLITPFGQTNILRVHGCFVSDAEIKRVVEFCKKQGKPFYKEATDDINAATDDDERDDLYKRAVELVQLNGQASTAFIQRRLRVGYNRAVRMIEMMQKDGIIGADGGSNPRDSNNSTSEWTCEYCEAPVKKDDKYCANCGKDAISTIEESSEGERSDQKSGNNHESFDISVTAVKDNYYHKIVGLMFLSIGLLITLSLTSYSATDPCFTVASSGAPIKNSIGIIGAFLSDQLLLIFGLSAYVIPLQLLGYGLFFTLGQEAVRPHPSKIGGILFFLSTGVFFGLGSETTQLFGEIIPSGGMLGWFIAKKLISILSNTGAYIITITVFIIALMLLKPFSLLGLLTWIRIQYGKLSDQFDLLMTTYRHRREMSRKTRNHPPEP